MAGLYLHIPYCRQKCHYCNFYSLASVKHRNEVVEAMKIEMALNNGFFGGEPLQTIYLGGGTPSILPVSQLDDLIRTAISIFKVAQDQEPEITVEANPDDVTDEWLVALATTPANRLSMGIQSFSDADLHYLNRVHSAAQAKASIAKAIKAGYSNLSIDLIYGIPTLTDEQWIENINTAIMLNIPHISAYALTVEPGTALDHLIRKGKYTPVDDDKAASHFALLMESLGKAGYEHYEISNFALPGRYSRHNTAYWNGSKYLGIGPSAHSFTGRARRWNVANLGSYIKGVSAGSGFYESEELTTAQQFNEYVMTSLRTMWGIDPRHVEQQFGQDFYKHLTEQAKHPMEQGWLIFDDDKLKLTSTGKLFADRIAAGLFY